ncbi:LysM peptidoglycan-binding domain-containing protein [bacterium]|nr:MAG: LysM peptidoglycan-binding domain-containing protein [bacterium]
MAAGLVLVIIVAAWLSTRPCLSMKARLVQSGKAGSSSAAFARQFSSPAARREPGINTADPSAGRQTVKVIQTPSSAANHSSTSASPAEPKFHIVQKGQTLSDISLTYYGSANQWSKILNANRQTIKDSNRLIPGNRLLIPD